MSIRKIVTILPLVLLIFSVASTASASMPSYGEEWQDAPSNTSAISFSDVPTNHWAYKYISEMVGRKVIDGYPDGKFRPNNTISRAEFAKIMVTASGIQAQKVNYSSFSDVPTTNWASPFVEAVKDYMTGYRAANGQYIFNPSAPALREDIAIALVKLKGYDVNRLPDHSTLEAMFKDYAGISESAKDYVALAVENGLVSGFPDETFRPQATVTRAEATVMLWRAYQYGNDNKDVGGGKTSITTPTQPQPSEPITPATPNQTQQPKANEKFTVDTLVGGNGEGDVDGPVRIAKINRIDSMVVDNSNNIFFLNTKTNKVRKFNHSNGTVETFRTINAEFDWNRQEGTSVTHYDYTAFTPNLLAFNSANNKLYLLGTRCEVDVTPDNRCFGNYFSTIHDISSDVQLATFSFSPGLHWSRFMTFNDQNAIIFGGYNSTLNSSMILEGELGKEANIIANSKDGTGANLSWFNDAIVDAIATPDSLYTFHTAYRELSKVQLYPRKVESVISFENMKFDTVTSHHGNFYISSGATIYELTTDGKLTTFINGSDLIYNDGNPIKKINHIDFDSKGNVIVYDDNNKAIRRINL
ncbi:S-layer homology domain-containing protein [Paenibacillus sp. SAFN-117]|uniref:S-layer homology domain-containing protein n=1 Tax=Paenibacillus sp. SAFN-117 TaxID=3436860 RepID=UPI003F7D771F